MKFENGVLLSKDGKKLLVYPYALTETSYSIPEGIEVIASYAFFKCTSLTTVTIPSSVKEINSHSFSGASVSTSQPNPCATDAFTSTISVNLPSDYKDQSFCGIEVEEEQKPGNDGNTSSGDSTKPEEGSNGNTKPGEGDNTDNNGDNNKPTQSTTPEDNNDNGSSFTMILVVVTILFFIF